MTEQDVEEALRRKDAELSQLRCLLLLVVPEVLRTMDPKSGLAIAMGEMLDHIRTSEETYQVSALELPEPREEDAASTFFPPDDDLVEQWLAEAQTAPPEEFDHWEYRVTEVEQGYELTVWSTAEGLDESKPLRIYHTDRTELLESGAAILRRRRDRT